MTVKDINEIIKIVCPNDEDYEKPIISPKYLRQELEQLAIEQESRMLEPKEPIAKKDLCECIDRDSALTVLDAEAWAYIDYVKEDIGGNMDCHISIFADNVRERLKELPTVTLGNDAISRQDTIDWLKKVTVTDGITFETGFKQILLDIKQMPCIGRGEK